MWRIHDRQEVHSQIEVPKISIITVVQTLNFDVEVGLRDLA